MNKVFKPVSVAFFSIILALSLSGCKDKDAQTAMNNGGLNEGVESIASDSGKVKVVLKPGVRAISVDFTSNETMVEHQGAIENSLKQSGVVIKRVRVEKSSAGGSSPFIHFDIEPMSKESIFYIVKNGLLVIEILAGDDIAAKWRSTGNDNEVHYAV